MLAVCADLLLRDGGDCVGALPVEMLIDNFDSSWDVSSKFYLPPSTLCLSSLPSPLPQFICNQGTVFTLKTDSDASRYRVVNIDTSTPEKVRSPRIILICAAQKIQ